MYFGYIANMKELTIEGWVSSSREESIDVTIYAKETYIGKVIPFIVINDVNVIQEYQFCKGFRLEFELSVLLTYFKNNPLEEIVLTLYVNDQKLEKEFSFSKVAWIRNFARKCTGENFLYYLPLIGHGLEKSLKLAQVVDTLLNLELYALTNVLVSERKILVNEISLRNIEDEVEYDKLYSLLSEHHDILLGVAKGIYVSDNKQLLSLVNQVINTINHQDAVQIIEYAAGDKDNIFNVENLNQRIEDDKLLSHLSNHPEEIMEAWSKFGAQERLDKAFSFMNLSLFLQEFDSMHRLELSLSELNKLVSSGVKLTVETLQQHLFSDNKNWEGLLLTLYFVSSDTEKQYLIGLSKNLINHLDKCKLINVPALEWLIRNKLFKNSEIENAVVNEMMQTLREVIDKRLLWDNALIKKTYFEYVNKLLVSNDPLFDNIYKLGLRHYLLDNDFFIRESNLSEQYLSKEQLSWVQHIEVSRKKAIKLLGDSSQTEALMYQLSYIEYLSPEIVKKIKFEIYRNILNLEIDDYKMINAAHGLLKVAGAYDGLIASSYLNDATLYKYYESALISNTIKRKSNSMNNYWYHQALLLRKSSEVKRLVFLQNLYMQISDIPSEGDEQLRLIRLFLSELLWSIEEGLKLEILSIDDMMINELMVELVSMNNKALEYSQIFEYYLKLVNNQTFDENSLLEENIDFETKKRLKEILKIKDNDTINKVDAIKYIRQAMLYPYTLVMIYSCQAYIPTRQKAIRETWINRAKEFGIDHIFVVGGNERSELKDDMMYLAADDVYERLPQKSVEMFRFAQEQFSHERFMKIDDDCFVNIDAYFSDDLLFNVDYYGRSLHRGVESLDRTWHQKKSQTIEAQNTIDLSPVPSIYADGSTGYVLSRLACEHLVKAYNDKANTFLVKNSFFEDKLVGDLLAGRGFKVNSANFTAVIYRKMMQEVEATFWEYNVLPTTENRVKILHCETESILQSTWRNFNNSNSEMRQHQYFSNRKIENFSGAWSGQPFIEEIKIETDGLRMACHIGVIVCKDEYFRLPALLEHHRKIGIEHFIYIDNISNDKSLEYMIDQEDVSVFAVTQEYKNFHFGMDWLETAFSNFCYGKWVLAIDADELFVFDDYENQSIETLTSYADKNGYDSFLAPTIDMYNKGKLAEAKLDNKIPYEVCDYFDSMSTTNVQNKASYGNFCNSVVISGGLRSRVFGHNQKAMAMPYINQKYCLFKYKPTHKFTEGIHYMGNNNPAPIRAVLLHFKYHAGFYDKVHKQILSGQHRNDSQEYKRYFNKLEHNDNLSLFDINISLKYEGSSSLIKAGYMDRIV